MIDGNGGGLLPNAYCPCNEMGIVEGRWKKAIASDQKYIIFGDVGYRLTTEYFTGDMQVRREGEGRRRGRGGRRRGRERTNTFAVGRATTAV